MKRLILCLLFLASAVQAQRTCPQSTVDYSPPVAAIVQITVKGPRHGSQQEWTYGTGTLIKSDDPRGIVVTCAHLFDAQTDSVMVAFPGGQQAEAEILYCNLVRELAVLAIPSTSVQPIVLASEPALRGDIVRASGYGARQEPYRTIGGPAIGYLPTKINRGESLLIPGGSRDGDSGGPMLNDRGELVGVIWGTYDCRTRGTYARRIRKILAQLFGREDTPAMTPMVPPPATESPATVSPPQPKPPTVADHLDKIRGRVADIEASIAALGDQTAEPPPSQSGPPVVAPPSLLESALPVALTALGWTGPPSVVALLAARFGLAAWRRRKARNATKPDGQPAPLPTHDDYASQLAEVYALSGRSPMSDLTLGREYDQELQDAATSSDGALASWAQELRQRVANRLQRIHNPRPTPVEPIDA